MDWTVEEMAAAFTEWHRRWKEEPERFFSEAESLSHDSTTYGNEVTPYFIAILEEQRAAASS